MLGTPRYAKASSAGASYNLDKVGQGPIALAVGAGWGCLDIFTLLYPFSLLSPSLWETVRYRPKYCLKGPLNPKQSINQSMQRQTTKICPMVNMWLRKRRAVYIFSTLMGCTRRSWLSFLYPPMAFGGCQTGNLKHST